MLPGLEREERNKAGEKLRDGGEPTRSPEWVGGPLLTDLAPEAHLLGFKPLSAPGPPTSFLKFYTCIMPIFLPLGFLA